MKSCLLILLSVFLGSVVPAQPGPYSSSKAHAHNDYLNPIPFYLAYSRGFASIEADVFPVEGSLKVAHSKKEIQSGNTLERLYITPLVRAFDSDGPRKLILLIDIKEDYRQALELLIRELHPLERYLSALGKPNYLTVVISGERPPPEEYRGYPDFIFFDDDLKRPHSNEEWKRVALVSLPFDKISQWKGTEGLKRKDRKRVAVIIKEVHAKGKPIRFWAAPDTRLSWKWQMKLGVDLIGTDKVSELAGFLSRGK